MAQAGSILSDKFAFYKILKLRRRAIFTSRDRLRLRYVLVNAVLALLLIGQVWPKIAHLGAIFSSDKVRPITIQNTAESVEHRDVSSSFVASMQPADVRRGADTRRAGPISASDQESSLPDQSMISQSMRSIAQAIQKKPQPAYRHVEIGKGDTLSGVLEKAGLGRTDVYFSIEAMKAHYDPRKVKPGQKIRVEFMPGIEDKAQGFKNFSIKLSPIKTVRVSKDADGDFDVAVINDELVKKSYAITTQIETSLYGSALKAGIPQNVVAEIIRLYSWGVDFQRDIRSGDKVEVFFEVMENDDGSYSRLENIIFANLGVGGRDKPIYRYKMSDGDIDYFEPNGRSIRKTLMRTPVDGARLSSGFGMRRHPVLGYNKMHKGVDFAAPTGTPIYAAGDGVIERMNRFGAYGNYVRIRHNSSLKTAYAHLHKFKRGLGKGSRVKQGEVIGYIGTTGRSTGPHLHYEVMLNGVQKNPRSVDVPTGEILKDAEHKKFKSFMGEVNTKYAQFSNGVKQVAGQF